ncbi:Gfo/Idh/MocA family oxidoreductase [Sphingobacterium sp. HJSM2_6]|uniref:Gfo/Idh/MocA family oxidoreductase n=1 Tax=Sphingobacterium sp. HJSM2_6 TaxID=3366264 RepID=UPI003BD8FF8A
MIENKIVTGILSYGMSGRVFHAPFIEVHPQFHFHAIVERTKKVAQELYPQVMSYDSVEELLADDAIECIIVNTPNDTHVAFAAQALKAGKHVLIEKPFAPTVEEAHYLFQLADEQGKLIMPFHNRRYDSDFLALKKIIDEELVGRPIELHLRFDRYKPEIGAKVFKETIRPAAGILYDLGSHLLDQAISLFGRPKSISKVKNTYRVNSLVDDYGMLMLNYASGVNVYITTSLSVVNPQASFVLHGTKGSFIKKRCDVQEAQLIAGMFPNDPAYGLEDPADAGELAIAVEQSQVEYFTIPAIAGNYMALFDEVYESIRLNKPYFVKRDHIIWQLQVLEPSK